MIEAQLPHTAPPFDGEAHYLGSFPKDGELYDYYEITLNGKTTFVYVKAMEVCAND